MTTGATSRGNRSRKKLSRRDFVKMAGTAVLAGCAPKPRPTSTPTISPSSTPISTHTVAPTATRTATDVPTRTPTATMTVMTTPTVAGQATAGPTEEAPVTPTRESSPTSTPARSRAEVMRTYPGGLSKVVIARNKGGLAGGELSPDAVGRTLDTAITELTGVGGPSEAWSILFAPEDRVAIKVNTIRGSSYWTRPTVVMAVVERLQGVGIPPESVVIFDRDSSELGEAGYKVNADGPGVRCYGTDGRYTGGWQIMGMDIKISDILLQCTALINMPILKVHDISGITFAMKNHYGSFDRPGALHGDRIGQGMAELNALAPIADRTRLIIGDATTICTRNWYSSLDGDSILLSFDSVAHDTIGLQLFSAAVRSEERNPARSVELAGRWLSSGAELGVGANDLQDIELVEVVV